MPYIVVPASQPKLPVVFTEADESDPGPYPIPADAPVEGGSDRHVLALQEGTCRLYEMYSASLGGGSWHAYSGALFDLRSNALRPDGWTSADAAGLPILPGLIRYDEVRAGAIRHALRFTVEKHPTRVRPPRDPFRLERHESRPSADGASPAHEGIVSDRGPLARGAVILGALKRYGMLVTDNGSNWFIAGASDTHWNDEALDDLKTIPGSAFEVVKSGPSINLDTTVVRLPQACQRG